jgi:hypothetical protein
MKKNAQLHILLETRLLNQLKKDAEEQEVSLGHLCRQRLKGRGQLDRIESKLDKLIKKN